MRFSRNITVPSIILLFLYGCMDRDLPEITVHLVGDSTMADKHDPENNPERGWGQMLHHFFGERVTISNHAVNGRSTKSFINEGRWSEVVKTLNQGD